MNNMYRTSIDSEERQALPLDQIIGRAREGPSAEVIAYVFILTSLHPFFIDHFLSEAQERRGEVIHSNFKIEITNTVYLLAPGR